MSQTCMRCYKIVYRACQSATESIDCPNNTPGRRVVERVVELPADPVAREALIDELARREVPRVKS